MLVLVPVVLFAMVAPATNLKVFALFSPATGMLVAFQPGYGTNAALFWESQLVIHLVSWLFLALASFILPRVWRDHSPHERKRRAPKRAAANAARRTRLLAFNPVWWLTARQEHQQRGLWAMVIGAAAIGVTIWFLGKGSTKVGWSLFGFAALVHLLVNVWVASEACYSFADARSSGAMELLLSTPLTVRQIVSGQTKAIKEFFLGPVVFLVFMDGLLTVAQIVAIAGGSRPGFASFGILLISAFSIAWFIADLFAVSRVGMWFALTSQKPTTALTKTILGVLVFPLLFAPCCSVMAGGLMLAKSIIFMTWAQSKLDNEFRSAAAGRFETPRAHWLKPPAGPPPLTMPQ